MAESPGKVQNRTGADDADDAWAASQIFGAEPSVAPPCLSSSDVREPEPVDLDSPQVPDPDPGTGNRTDAGTDDPGDVNAGAKKSAAALGAALVVAIVAIFGALTVFSRPDPVSPSERVAPSVSQQAPASPVPASVVPLPDQDQAVPFTASANCPAGSTAAQALTDAASDSAWVCVRGAPGGQVDGQVLHIDLGRTYLLTAVSITPGWVAKTPGGKEEWRDHRVVTRLQYIFNDDDRSIFTQDTGNTHGPVTTPLPRKVLASRVTVIILQTARPPASPLPGPDPSGDQPGFLDSVLGDNNGPAPADATQTSEPDAGGQTDSDPVDSTFAISAMTFFGHLPG
jgi:hypothetical protein